MITFRCKSSSGMATYECPGQRSVSIGEHLEGYGVVIGIDDMPAELRLDETMSITNGLRNYAHAFSPTANTKLLEIADHIDEEHKKSVKDALNDALFHANEDDMAELGWTRLPVDDDGEVVRVGSLCKVYPFGEPAKRVRALRVSEFGWFVIFEDGTEEQRYRIRVYKPPTTEDVLDEFASAYDRIGGSDEEHQKYLDLIAEYAAKLQLKENA